MNTAEGTHDVLRRLLEESDGSIRLSDFIARHAIADDELIAELIEIDGRRRLARGSPLSLDDYLTEIPGISDSNVVLDAAIDMVLRSRSGSSRPDASDAAALIDEYPHLRTHIETAWALGSALWETEQTRPNPTPYCTRLPAPFGPMLDDGRTRYTLEDLLGNGAFGEVYRATDNLLSDADRPAHVAIKVFSSATANEDARRRFADEATKARRVDHPNVARVLDRGITDEDREFIVYEYISGSSLDTLLRSYPASNRTMPAREAAALIAKAARGVQAIHMAGMAHCDLKPGNIMVNDQAEPKIVDLGVARRVDQSQDRTIGYLATQPMGSLAFMSPEQYKMLDGALSPPCDVYALGGVLYWLLTGRLPNGETPDEIGKRLAHPDQQSSERSYSVSKKRIDPSLRLIIERALAPDPIRRYDSASSLADNLEAWLRREPIRWQNPSRLTVAALAARRRPLNTALILGLALALIASGFVSQHYHQQAKAAEERAKFEQRWRMSALNYQASMFRIRKELYDTDFLGKSFYIMDMMLHDCGPQFFNDHDAVRALNLERVQTLEDRIAKLRINFGAPTIEALIIQTALGMTHVHERNHAAAIPVLEKNVELWKTTIPAHDPQIACAIILLESARADRLLDQIGASPPTQSNLDEARTIASRLSEALDRFVGTATGGPVRIQGYRRLEALYGPALLDDHTRYEQAYAIARVDEALMRK